MRPLSQSEWKALRAAAQSGNRLHYWIILKKAGDGYAALALQVVTDSTVAGRAANRWFVHKAALEGQAFDSE